MVPWATTFGARRSACSRLIPVQRRILVHRAKQEAATCNFATPPSTTPAPPQSTPPPKPHAHAPSPLPSTRHRPYTLAHSRNPHKRHGVENSSAAALRSRAVASAGASSTCYRSCWHMEQQVKLHLDWRCTHWFESQK